MRVEKNLLPLIINSVSNDSKFSTKTKTKPVQNLFRYSSLKKLFIVSTDSLSSPEHRGSQLKFLITSSFQFNERGLWKMKLSTIKKKLVFFFCCKTPNLPTNPNDTRTTNKARSSFQSRAAAAETHKIVQNGAIEACLILNSSFAFFDVQIDTNYIVSNNYW